MRRISRECKFKLKNWIAVKQSIAKRLIGQEKSRAKRKAPGLLKDVTKTVLIMKLKLLLFCFLSFVFFQWSWAQTRVSGKIVDENNEPLIGVNILVKGAPAGTVSDIDGNYSFGLPDGATTLVFSYVGYRTQEVAIEGRSTIDMVMPQDIAGLEEVVVIGYGTRKRRDISASVSQITSKDIVKSVALSPEFALQGRTPGIQVQNATGDPNARPTIRIRGVGTIGFNDPLIVIDGIPLTEFGAGPAGGIAQAAAGDLRGSQNLLNLINPQDIESISVLKDAAATAIYGLRASNGVILIETKRGQGLAKPQVSLSMERGVRNLRDKIDALSTPEYVTLITEQYRNAGEALPPWLDPANAAYLGGRGVTYSYQDEMVNRNAVIENYNLNVRGGNQRASFFLSGGFANQEGTLRFNEFKRYSLAANSDFQITNWLKVGETFRFAYTEGDDTRSGSLSEYFRKPPWQPIFDPDDPTGFARMRNAQNQPLWGDESRTNDLAVSTFNFTKYNMLRNLGNVYVQVTPVKGLILRSSLAADWVYNRRNSLQSRLMNGFHITDNRPQGTTYGERHLRNWNLVYENMANYNFNLGTRHNFDLLANYSFQKYGFEGIQGGAEGVRFEDEQVVTLTPAAIGAVARAESFREPRRLAGFLGRFSYNFDSKYYLDFSYRRDGSSVFGPGFRFGDFYGISGAWRVSAEPFMKSLSFINDLKLRASWGETGNQETRPFGYTSAISLGARYPLGGVDNALGIGSFPSNFPIPNLSWELNVATNFGIDVALLDYRLTGTFEIYDRLTKGILRPLELPITVGVPANPAINLAQVSNKGIELQLGWNDRIGQFTYNISGNLTTVNNQVLKLFRDDEGNDRILGGNYAIQVGQPIDFIHGYKVGGIFQTEEEVRRWREQFNDPGRSDALAPGDFFFQDLFGNPGPGEYRSPTPDGIINEFDRTYLGKVIPGYYYGFNIGGGWKNFDVSLFFQGVGDIQKVNQIRQAGEAMTSRGLNQMTTTKDRWTPTNPSTTMPRALAFDRVGNTRFSDRWVEDADYLRFQNLQFGYSLGRNALAKIGFENLRVYLSGTNMAIFTRYSGLEPEVNLSNEPDFNPPPVVWMLGVNATF
jgi:TonB-linked SusC/RagA family outer membrane protein